MLLPNLVANVIKYNQVDGRVKNRSTIGAGGTGTGLPVCRKNGEQLDGLITLSSETGQSSTFSVELARDPAEC